MTKIFLLLQKYYNTFKLKIAATLLSVIIALLLFKGLFLLTSVINSVFLGLSDSTGELAVSYIGMVFFLLPGEIFLILLTVFLFFRLSMKATLDWYQISGFILSLIVIFYYGNFFLGSVGTFSVATNLIVGSILIVAGVFVFSKILNKIKTSSEAD